MNPRNQRILQLNFQYNSILFFSQTLDYTRNDLNQKELWNNSQGLFFLFRLCYNHFLSFFLSFLTSLLEYNCFTMVCQFLLYNKVNQLYIYIYPHISSLLRLPRTLPIPPLQVVTKHRADLPVLCGCFPLAIYFTFGSVYMSMPLSLHPSLPFPLPVSSSPFSTSLSLFLSCPQAVQNLFFGFQIPYICVSIRYLFFSF